MAEDPIVGSRKPPVILALIDLTRILYFGPAVLSVFLIGAVLAMPDGRMWSTLLRVLFLGVVGFSGGFVLNDWADCASDRVMLDARMHHPEYVEQLRKERRFTGTRPMAAGIISPSAGLAFALVLIAISGAVALTLPSPHRWYVLAGLAFGTAAEPLYCVLKRKQTRFPFATFLSAALVGICPAVGYLAVREPDLTALALFVSLYFWELGFNQLYDTVDTENDRLRGITTLSRAIGLRFVAGWCLLLSVLSTASFVFVWRSTASGSAMLAGICAAALILIGTDAVLLARPRLRTASAAIGIHQVFVIIIVAATVIDAILRWTSAY